MNGHSYDIIPTWIYGYSCSYHTFWIMELLMDSHSPYDEYYASWKWYDLSYKSTPSMWNLDRCPRSDRSSDWKSRQYVRSDIFHTVSYCSYTFTLTYHRSTSTYRIPMTNYGADIFCIWKYWECIL